MIHCLGGKKPESGESEREGKQYGTIIICLEGEKEEVHQIVFAQQAEGGVAECEGHQLLTQQLRSLFYTFINTAVCPSVKLSLLIIPESSCSPTLTTVLAKVSSKCLDS